MPNLTRLRTESDEPSIAALLRQIVDDIGHLARAEINLARAEITANVQTIARPVVMLMLGGLLGIAALFTLMGAAVAALTPLVGAALAALIVAVVVGVVAALLVMSGVNGFGALALTPGKTVASVRADVAVVRDAAK